MKAANKLLMLDGGGGKFSPVGIAPGLTFWTDPSQLATVTLNSGDVSQINDLSGQAHHASQAVIGQQPLYLTGGAGINGKSVISYTDVNNDELDLANALGLGRAIPGLSFVGIIRIPTFLASQRIFTILTTGNATLLGVQINTSRTMNVVCRRVAADTFTSLSSIATINASIAAFIAATINYNTGEVVLTIDAVTRSQIAAWVTGATNADVDAPNAPTLGRNMSSPLGGDIAECCYWPRTLTPSEVSNLRTSYFKPKWGTP